MYRVQNSCVAWMPLIVLAPLLMVFGCGQSTAVGRGVAVSGTITLDGKPLEGATVNFLNDTFAGFGRTNADGKYRLVQGALPGTNKIVISKLEGGAAAAVVEDTEAGMDSGQYEAAAMGSGGTVASKPKDLVPEDYSDPEKTKLTYEVPADGASGVDFSI